MISYDLKSGQMQFLSWQDPHLKRTLDLFRRAPEFLRQGATGDILARAKVTVMQAEERPCSPQDLGRRSLERYLQNHSVGSLDHYRNQLFDARIEEIVRCADLLGEALKRGASVVVYGNRPALEQARAAGENLMIRPRFE